MTDNTFIHLHKVAMVQCKGLPTTNAYDQCSASATTTIPNSYNDKAARDEAAERFRKEGWAIDDETPWAICPKCKEAYNAGIEWAKAAIGPTE